MDTKQTIVFVIGNETKKVKLTNDIDFFLKSPLIKGPEELRDCIMFDLTYLTFIPHKHSKQTSTFLMGDLEILLDFFQEGISMEDYPRAYGICHFIISHSGLIKQDEALSVERLLNAVSIVAFEEFICCYDSDSFFVTNKETYDAFKTVEGYLPFQMLTVKMGDIEIVHAVCIGEGIPVYPHEVRNVIDRKGGLLDARSNFEFMVQDIITYNTLGGLKDTFEKEETRDRFRNNLQISNYPGARDLYNKKTVVYYHHIEFKDGKTPIFSWSEEIQYIDNTINKHPNCIWNEDYTKASNVKKNHGLCSCYDVSNGNKSDHDFAVKDGMQFMINLSRTSHGEMSCSDFDIDVQSVGDKAFRTQILEEIKELVNVDYETKDLPFMYERVEKDVTLRTHFGFVRLE